MHQIESCLRTRFPKGGPFREYLGPLVKDFADSGRADLEYVNEFCNGDDGAFWSRAWEAVLYSRFKRLGWCIEQNRPGPDFRITSCHGPVLVEAVVPAPCGIPPDWLAEHNGVKTMPHEEMLLRWTSAIADKRRKHDLDFKRGVVSRDTPFVIAVNGCRLSRLSDDYGISQWPFVVEAVFPIGPIEVPFNRDKGELGQARQGRRSSVRKDNGAAVSTDSFLNPDHKYVSALIGCASIYADEDTRKRFAGAPPMFVVNNPLAENPLPPGWLPNSIEYRAEKTGDGEVTLSRSDSSKEIDRMSK